MSLDDWLRNSWLAEHETSPEEIASLLTIVERDLANAAIAGLSADWKLNIAYNAALQAATATARVKQLDRFRKKRNIGGYEAAGVVSDREAAEMFELAVRLRDEVLAWLRANHPDLVRP